MRATVGLVAVLVIAADIAAARDIPLPRPRPVDRVVIEVPDPIEVTDSPAPPPSACRLRLTSELAVAPSLPATGGPNGCEGPDLVRLEAVVLPDNKGRVALNPPAVLRCPMAETVVNWIREDVAPAAAEELGSALKSLDGGSYECRNRNRSRTGKLSEHGRANALDLGKLRLANGQVIDLTNPAVEKDFRTNMRQSACARFTTVLGPGADSSHEDHVHVDLAQRRSGYRMCQWDVREPAPPRIAHVVPLPPPRPKLEDDRDRARGKRAVHERNALR
jgi:hypothetical protein